MNDKVRYFIPKIVNRFRSKKNKIWKYLYVGKISLWGYKSIKDASLFKERLQLLLGHYNNSILIGISDDDESTIFKAANQTLNHVFDLLGSGPTKQGNIDWHVDLKTKQGWGKNYYRDISPVKGSDFKMPWEFSRCSHLLWLGEAYLLSNEEKYAKEIKEELNWWINDNPFMYSVNWTCAMEVAFRAVNWLFALNMISSYNGFDDEFAEKVGKSLWQHAFYIRNNLEKQIPYSNNHYASDIVGLLYLGALFNETARGKEWFKFGLKEFKKEVKTQVLDSGVHYERSISYHRLMAELFSYPIYMLKRIREDIPEDITERITKMYAYISTYTKPNKFAPLIADNDDGRFVPLLKRNFRRHDYLNNPLSVENRFVALGCSPFFYSKLNDSRLYADANVAILRSDSCFLYVNNGGYSKHPKDTDMVIGTHTHNDLLSFELNILGEDVIIDPGTYLYTSDIARRNEFRSTYKHNTVVVDGEEQNILSDTEAFVVRRNVLINNLKYENDLLIGMYKTLQGQLKHKRCFELKEDKLVIHDSLAKNGGDHKAVYHLHFSPDVIANLRGNQIDIKVKKHQFLIYFPTLIEKISIIEDNVSPSYGVLVPSKTAEYSFSFSDYIEFDTIISWKT